MLIIYLTCYVVAIGAAGYCVIAWLTTDREWSWAAIAGTSILAGIGALAMIMFWWSLTGRVPSRGLLIVITIAALSAIAWRRQRHGLVAPASPPDGPRPQWRWTVLLCLPLVLTLALVVIHAVGYNYYSWDGYIIWGFKAKVVATDPVRAATYFHDLHLQSTHTDYPLLVPFAMAGAHVVSGAFNDAAAKFVHVLFYAGLVLLIYDALRRWLNAWQALLLTAVYGTMPNLVTQAGMGEADVPLAALYAATLVFILRWVDSRQLRDLLIAAVFGAATVFCKNEGLPIVVLVVVATLIIPWRLKDRRMLKHAAIFAVVVAALSAPWLWFNHSLPHSQENYLQRMQPDIVMANLHRAPDILRMVAAEALDHLQWNGIWLLCVAALILKRRTIRDPAVVFLVVLGACHASLYFLVYIIGPTAPDDIIPVTAYRLLLHISPVVVLIIGCQWRALRADCDEPKVER